jgi:AcrR family transcriptional regulator
MMVVVATLLKRVDKDDRLTGTGPRYRKETKIVSSFRVALMGVDRKEEIADVFQKHFDHFGYKKVTVDEIARELKISKKTIYQHFNTKEEIFYFVVSRVARRYVASMTRKLEPCPTVRDKVTRLIHLIFAETRRWLKQNDAFEFRYKFEIAELAFKDAFNELIAALLIEGVESGELHDLDVAMTVRFINGVMSESMRALSMDRSLPVEEQTVAAVGKLLS